MTSAPAGWTADFDIARRSLLIAPPAEYTDGMDLENTVTIQSDDKPILSQEYYVLDFTHPEGTFVLIEGNMTSENGTIVYFDQHMRYHEKVYNFAIIIMIDSRSSLPLRHPLSWAYR